MKIITISNYFNHHQLAFAQSLTALHANYKFIEMGKISQERLNLGYKDLTNEFNGVVKYTGLSQTEKMEIDKEILEADLVIIAGDCKDIIKERLVLERPTFRYSERIFKSKKGSLLSIKNLLRAVKYRIALSYEKKAVHLLSTGNFSSRDYHRIGLYKNRTYAWGYFPIVNMKRASFGKKKNTLLWVGRLIDIKNPFYLIKLAKTLKEKEYSFEIQVIGDGALRSKMEAEIKSSNLEDYIKLIGTISFDKVYEYYQSAEYFLFTSDNREGWGAVLNEAMSYGCIPIVSNGVGATKYLIDENTGFVFKYNSTKDFIGKTLAALNLSDEQKKKYSENAQKKIIELWNADVAAKNLVKLVESNFTLEIEEGPLKKI